MKFIHFKCTVWRLSVNIYSHVTLSIVKLNNISMSPQKPLIPLGCQSRIPALASENHLLPLGHYSFTFFRVSHTIQQVGFCDWLLSLSVMCLRFFCIVSVSVVCSSFIAQHWSIVWDLTVGISTQQFTDMGALLPFEVL